VALPPLAENELLFIPEYEDSDPLRLVMRQTVMALVRGARQDRPAAGPARDDSTLHSVLR
jgi:hypothetical protein